MELESLLSTADSKHDSSGYRALDTRLRVALLVETSKSFGRGLLRGIKRYTFTHQGWSIYIDERGLGDSPPVSLSSFNGLIVRSADKHMLETLLDTGLPVVNLGESTHPNLPMLDTDDDSICHMAAQHLLERGYRHFGYVGFQGARWSDRRRDKFLHEIKQAGFDCSVCEGVPWEGHEELWPKQQEVLTHWIEDLPRPAGVFACYDVMGLRLLDVCRALRISVPERVAVIGVDNDEIICDLADPPLSSVAHDVERIGYESAKLLDQLMAATERPDTFETAFVAPLGVVTRSSTDTVAIDDPLIAAALRFIRLNASRGIQVSDVLEHVRISRTTLEKGFRKAIKRTPKGEILRLQIKHAQHLLTETDYALSNVSRLAGFNHTEHFCKIFKQKVGVTPGQYRVQVPGDNLDLQADNGT